MVRSRSTRSGARGPCWDMRTTALPSKDSIYVVQVPIPEVAYRESRDITRHGKSCATCADGRNSGSETDMPTHRVTPDCELHYRLDDFTGPWREPATILMLHGNSESGAARFAWVPHLARHYRVVRPDMRGFGASTPMPRGFAWTLDRLCDDYIGLMDELGVKRFHVVAAKIGGTIARHFAARHPDRVLTLTVVGTP